MEEEKLIQREIWKREAEEKRKRREEEERIKLEEEEAEKKRLEEKEKIRKQREEEKRRKKEEERKIKEAELKLLQEKWKREEEERRKKEEEEEKERRRLEKEEEERRIKEERELERKRKEKEEILKTETLKKMNKREEDLTDKELQRLLTKINYKVLMEEYEEIIHRSFNYNKEGKNIKHSFEKIKQISTDNVKNLEVTDTGKIVALTQKGGILDEKDCSKITIYKKATYEEEKSETLNSHVNSFKIYGNKIYCSLLKENNNILIISLDNFEDKTYLDGHFYQVTDLTLTSYGYLLSSDIKGNIKVWKDNAIKKSINDFCKKINTVSEINESQQRIAILSFREEKVKLYDLRYNELLPLATINNIKGSGLQNNMLKLNQNILAIAGTFIYIVDINSFIVTNTINCFYANDCISTSLILNENKGYFFVSQAMTDDPDDELEKGTIGFYEYDFDNFIIPDKNPLIKIGSKNSCHESFISSIRSIGEDTIVTGAYDGTIKFWKIKDM